VQVCDRLLSGFFYMSLVLPVGLSFIPWEPYKAEVPTVYPVHL
jgi:hypothetical protein